MKEGAWIEGNGRWHWIDDHANWIRRPENAHRAGLAPAAALKLAGMPRRKACGAERNAILLEAMGHGLIRFRGHGTEVTFETTQPLAQAMLAAEPFMAAHFGPYTQTRWHQLPEGPFLLLAYGQLGVAAVLARAKKSDVPVSPLPFRP